MTAQVAVTYAGWALAYAAASSLLLLGGLRLAGLRPGMWSAGLALTIFFPVFLGLHPFPDPATLDCSKGGAAVVLQPFTFLDGYRRLWDMGAPPRVWLRNLGIVAPVMNLLLFAPIGGVLALRTGRWRVAAIAGLAVTLFIEIAQLTALFGFYPCRYRHFETDDLILNTAGVVLGFAATRWIASRSNR
jgi:hypothetical protein